MAFTDLYTLEQVKEFINVAEDDDVFTTFLVAIDRDILDYCGPHSGMNTLEGSNGFMVFQPRCSVASVSITSPTPAPAFEATPEDIRITDSYKGKFTVSYMVSNDEVTRRRIPFIEMVKVRLGYDPQLASASTGLLYDKTHLPDMNEYWKIMASIRTLGIL